MAIEQILRQEIKQIKSAMRNGVKRSKISLAGNDDGKYQISQVNYFGIKTKNTHIINPYGLASNPSENEEGLMFNVMGQEENTAIIPYAVKSRFKGLQKGEVRVGNPLSSASVLFRNDGVASINGSEFEGIPKIVELTTKLNNLVTEHNTHTHTGVQTGAGVSGFPSTLATSFSKSDYENTNVVHGQQGTGTSGGAGGAGGTVEWGNITGTLSNQADLQAALDAKLSAETDPIFSASPAFGISAGDITNWNTAYSWGDHSVEGYLKNIVEDTTPQLGGDLDTNTFDIKFLDNDKAIFGTGLDFEIYHDTNDTIFRNLLQDKFTRFFGNYGGVDTELLTLDHAGRNVGIGNPNPAFTLDIAEAITGADFSVATYSSNANTASRLFFLKSHSDTLGSLVQTVDGELLGRFLCQGVNSSNINATGAIIEFQQNGTSGSRPPTDINFKTATSSVNATTRLSIKTDGMIDFWENPLANVGDITHDDATASDWILKNADQDKDIIFNVNDGGVDTEVMRFDGNSGYIAIGQTSANYPIDLKLSITANPASQQRGAYFLYETNNTSPTVISQSGSGFRADYWHSGSGNMTGIGEGFVSNAFNLGTGNVNELRGGRHSVGLTNSGNITTSAGLYIGIPFIANGGTITTNYGVFVQNQQPTGVTKGYGIYVEGSTDNYIAGNLGIGTSSPSEKIHSTAKVRADTVFNVNGTDGASGTFTTADAKTVTVTGGIITSIV
jgi:hypothetical protein